MSKWIVNRVVDLLVALLIIVGLIWYVLTQPVFSVGHAVPRANLNARVLDTQVRELLATSDATVETRMRLKTAANYIAAQLTRVGTVENLERANGLQYSVSVSRQGSTDKTLAVALHHIVTDKPVLPLAETTQGLVEWVKSLAPDEADEGAKKPALSLRFTVFLHAPEDLPQGISNASLTQVERLLPLNRENLLCLVFIPGLTTPEVAYTGGYWRYFKPVLPAEDSDLALYGRLEDVNVVHTFKAALKQRDFPEVDSLNLPVHYTDLPPSVMRIYWDRNLPALLVRPSILTNQRAESYKGQIEFVSIWRDLVEKGF